LTGKGYGKSLRLKGGKSKWHLTRRLIPFKKK
jgi:hypothetical protein